jgi:diacylglycerol O-acyltransferase / wax synthase
MLIRLHHAVADGIAALALMGALLDSTPAAPPPAAPPWRPAPAPGAWQLFTDNLRLHADGLAAAVAALGDPAPVVDRLGSRVRQMRLLAGEGRARRLSLNQPAGRRRRLLIARADLTQAKAAAHAHGATVNDVVLAAVAGGAHRLLAGRGELRPGLAGVTVNIREGFGRAQSDVPYSSGVTFGIQRGVAQAEEQRSGAATPECVGVSAGHSPALR